MTDARSIASARICVAAAAAAAATREKEEISDFLLLLRCGSLHLELLSLLQKFGTKFQSCLV
jgi:hypothetical protein